MRGEAQTWLDELKNINNFQKKSLASFIGTITHLLFGTEVFKSPGCIIIHRMALELVQGGDYSFEYLFGKVKKDGKKTVWEKEPALPITRLGAMPSLRWINLNYSVAVNKNIENGIARGDSKVRSFIKAESKIMQDWFELRRDEKSKILDKLLCILKTCREWFGLDLETKQLLADFAISTLKNEIGEEELKDLKAEDLKNLMKIVWEKEPALPGGIKILPIPIWGVAENYQYDRNTGKIIASDSQIEEICSFIKAEIKKNQEWFRQQSKKAEMLDNFRYILKTCKEWFGLDLETKQLLVDFTISALENDVNKKELEDLNVEDIKNLIKIKENCHHHHYEKIIDLKEVVNLKEIVTWYRDHNKAFFIIIRRDDYKEFIQKNYGELGLKSILYKFCQQKKYIDEADLEPLELNDLATLVEVIDDYRCEKMIELYENDDIELSKLIEYYGGEEKEAFLQIVYEEEPRLIRESGILEVLVEAYKYDNGRELLPWLLRKKDECIRGGSDAIIEMIDEYKAKHAEYGYRDVDSDGSEIDIGAQVDNDKYDYHYSGLECRSDDSQNLRGSSNDEYDYEKEFEEKLSSSSLDDTSTEITNDEIIDKIEEKLLSSIEAREEGYIAKINKNLFAHTNIGSTIRIYCTTTLGISSNHITSDESDYRIIINQHALDILKQKKENNAGININ